MNTEQAGTAFEQLAPAGLAESWDNPGWQVRVPGEVTGVLLAMEATSGVIDEASRTGCNVVFTHHPAIFKPLKSLDLESSLGKAVGEAIRRGISIWSAHTNLDVSPFGTSFALAAALGIQNARVLSRSGAKHFKLVVFVPASHLKQVKSAIASAGAGRIGDYSGCFWQVLGSGEFKPEAGADPSVGEVGRTESVEEYRLESVVPERDVSAVIAAMRAAHPYEEVAFDLYPLSNPVPSRVADFGYGAIGTFATPLSTAEAARHAVKALDSAVCSVAGRPDRLHERVAVVGGSGTSFMGEAIRGGATLFITADVRYHDAQDAVDRGLDLIVLDHYSTERPVLESVQVRLTALLPGVPVCVSALSSSPYVRIEP